MRHHVTMLCRLSLWLLCAATALQAAAQHVELNPQRNFPKTVPPGNYSGITWLGGHRYAVANDKSPTAGFYLMTIVTDSLSGDILDARVDSFLTDHHPNRDEEGICYVPQWHTVFVSGEADNEILEYTMHGKLTGRKLAIPEVFRHIYPNSGFEALTYNARTHHFWTTSEQTLQVDGPQPTLHNDRANLVRLQCFNDSLQPCRQYWYRSDSVEVKNEVGESLLGICGMAALDDGKLVVLEREARLTPSKVGSYVHNKIYIVNPPHHPESQTHKGEAPVVLHKVLLTEFTTRINLTARSFANYEGICIGPRLADGSMLLVMCADSQNQYKGYLKDWFRTVKVRVVHQHEEHSQKAQEITKPQNDYESRNSKGDQKQ